MLVVCLTNSSPPARGHLVILVLCSCSEALAFLSLASLCAHESFPSTVYRSGMIENRVCVSQYFKMIQNTKMVVILKNVSLGYGLS